MNMFRTVVTRITLACLALLMVAILLSLWVSRPRFDEQLATETLGSIAIAPPEQALTFARFREGEHLRVLLVTKYQDNKVTGFNVYRHIGIDLSDPIALFARLGYTALERAALSGAMQETVDVSALAMPFDPPAHHIAIGTNYPEHARESQVEEKPFVFPKRVQPTHFLADVSKQDSRLLDYEAELGFVALQDLQVGAAPPTLGLVLGNDFTDRWSLVRNLDRNKEMGTTGFVEGKSREGYAPIGNLLVIPKNLAAFYPEVELSLYVNGRLRQRDKAGAMVWGPQAMLGAIFECESWTFHRYDQTVPLLPRAGILPAGTIIFSGTPAGVIFKPLNLWNHWAYLQVGDEVIMHAEHLGSLRNRVIE
jgi:2,4-didehydro-3-deoxy-L-rhamnonate hydrolase